MMRKRFEHLALVLVIVVLMAPVLIAVAHAFLPAALGIAVVLWLFRWIGPFRM